MATPVRYYSSTAIPGTLGTPGGISNSATTLWLQTTPSGYPGQYPFSLVVDGGTSLMEIMQVSAGAGTAASPWTVTRGYDGTVAVAHSYGASVAHQSIANDFTLSRAHEALGSGSGVHGLPSSAWQQGAFAVISETTLSSSTTSIVTFSSIPQTYSHLMLVVMGRLTAASAYYGEVVATINGDTAARYASITAQAFDTGGGSNIGAVQQHAQSAWNLFMQIPSAQTGSAVNAGVGWAIFPMYAGTAYNKLALALSGWGHGLDEVLSGLYRTCIYNPVSQGGITSLALAASVGNFQSGSYFGLYGIG